MAGAPLFFMAGIAQLVEPRIVIPVVAGSSPVGRPKKWLNKHSLLSHFFWGGRPDGIRLVRASYASSVFLLLSTFILRQDCLTKDKKMRRHKFRLILFLKQSVPKFFCSYLARKELCKVLYLSGTQLPALIAVSTNSPSALLHNGTNKSLLSIPSLSFPKNGET